MHDPLEPSPIRVSDAIGKSRRYWHTLLAQSSSKSGLPQSCNNLNALLHNTPAMPCASEIDDIYEAGSLFLKGFSVWGTGTTKCDINGQGKVSQTSKIILGLHQPQYCRVTNNECRTGVEDQESSSATNFLFAMVLGWCYVLAARHIELRGVASEDGVFYTDSQAPRVREEDVISDHSRAIPIGSTDAAECRWWAAILSQGSGWRAVLCRAADVFHTPWSCHLDRKEQFQLRHSCHTSDLSQLSPPSAAQAREYLINFANRHDAVDQLLAAFAASLTIPSHGRFGTAVCLPALTVSPGFYKTTPLQNSIPSVDQLPHFMALSCIPNILSSSVFGCFWEPEVECNLVSEWLGPLLQECIPYLLKADRFHTIIHMMAQRRPNSAPLWLGMWVTGLIPRLFDLVEKIIPSISLEATHWIASSQSFMDPILYGVPRIEKKANSQCFIRREDEFRSLFLIDIISSSYPSPPICPWAPFGQVGIETCAIEVREHIRCGHRPMYQYWTWLGRNDQRLEDHGLTALPMPLSSRIFRALLALLETFLLTFKKRSIPQIKKISDDSIHNITLSRSATRNTFTWTLSDGTKPEDSEYWEHDWLDGLLDGFEDDEL
jgi:hypothetical protein